MRISAHLIPACCLIGLAFLGNKPYVCVALLTIALGSGSSVTVSSLQNPYDLSPNFSTTIFAFMHTIGSSAGYIKMMYSHLLQIIYLMFTLRFISPMVVAYFTKNRVRNKWTFFIVITIFLFLEYWRWVAIYIFY